MNLIDEDLKPKKTDNSKKIAKIILAIILLVIVIIIGIFVAIMYIQDSKLKLYINGSINEKVKQMLVIEQDGTIYVPIREIAPYLGYESFSGEYTDKSEDASKCYIQNEDEIANFALNSKKVYKLTTSNSIKNYDYFYADKPIKAINGKLYATTTTIEEAFNILFDYNEEKQRMYIYTMPYLIDTCSAKILDYGYEKISENFINKKAILNDMLIVTKNNDSTYAVIDINGNPIIEPKYEYIEYLPNSKDFLVQSNGKMGIISAKKETKVQILYDSLELIDNEVGLYIAQKNDKYGVIDSKGNIKVYIEYDQIGIDISKFEQNGIKNKYLLDNGMIPAEKDNLWGAFDKNGNQILDFEYDSFGYIAKSNKNAINLLMIPDYNVIIASKNKKYTLINSVGEELCLPVLDDVYMTISAGNKYYYMNYNNNIGVNVEDFLDELQMTKGNVKVNAKNNTTNENNVIEENVSNDENQQQVDEAGDTETTEEQ